METQAPLKPVSNSDNLSYGLHFVERLIELRLAEEDPTQIDPRVSALPDLAFYDDQSPFGEFVKARSPSLEEYVILLLALAPHVRPGFIEGIVRRYLPESGDWPEIGGTRDPHTRDFLPTGETALYVLAGDDLEQRFRIQGFLAGDHWLRREGIVLLESTPPGRPLVSGRLLMDPDHVERFTVGRVSAPRFGSAFPAHQISTDLDWSELILSSDVRAQIAEIRDWLEHHRTLRAEWEMARRVPPGYRALFHGPPGTGKTLTATLLGKHTGRKIFRIDLSTVVSKYIGETEKNLASLFDRARSRDWILFFDEADALFGKRTGVSDAHDRYANQEVSYLLQRVEDFDGLVILATNFKANLDDAFLRRFNAVIKFPFPEEADRARIWTVCLPQRDRWEDGVDLPAMLARFELAGGGIVNAVQHACIQAIARGSQTLTLKDALLGVRREIEKEGRVFRNVLE